MPFRVASVTSTLSLLAAAAGILVACGTSDPRTPEEAAARGDERLRAMSDALTKAQAFSFDTSEKHERVRRNGEKREEQLERKLIVRRPDRLWFHTKKQDGEHTAWYDGKTLTVVAPPDKIFARANVAPTLDGMLDQLLSRFDVPVPVADVLYSSPYESFALQEAKGGWVRRIDVEGRPCDELAYQHRAVDFAVWIDTGAPALPCRLDITYKARPGAPKSSMVFRNWNLAASIPDNQFAAIVPAGYEQIPVVERIPADQVKETLGPAAPPSAPAKTKR